MSARITKFVLIMGLAILTTACYGETAIWQVEGAEERDREVTTQELRLETNKEPKRFEVVETLSPKERMREQTDFAATLTDEDWYPENPGVYREVCSFFCKEEEKKLKLFREG